MFFQEISQLTTITTAFQTIMSAHHAFPKLSKFTWRISGEIDAVLTSHQSLGMMSWNYNPISEMVLNEFTDCYDDWFDALTIENFM